MHAKTIVDILLLEFQGDMYEHVAPCRIYFKDWERFNGITLNGKYNYYFGDERIPISKNWQMLDGIFYYDIKKNKFYTEDFTDKRAIDTFIKHVNKTLIKAGYPAADTQHD